MRGNVGILRLMLSNDVILSLCTVAKMVISEGLDNSNIMETGLYNMAFGVGSRGCLGWYEP